MPIVTLKSKTHLWAIIKGVAGSSLLVVPQFREFLPLEAYGIILGLITMVDIVLRNITTTAISDK